MDMARKDPETTRHWEWTDRGDVPHWFGIPKVDDDCRHWDAFSYVERKELPILDTEAQTTT